MIDIDLPNNQNLILATIYCLNGNPNLRLFETINNLSDNVMFVGDFNSKLEAFGCAKKNTSGPMLKNIQNQLNLIYLNTDEHTHLDRYTGNTDILDMAFSSQNLLKHDIQFLIDDDLGSDHLPIEIAIDTPPHRNIHINPVRYKFNQTDREVFESTLEAALSSGDIPKLKSTQDIDKYADFITTAISTAVDTAIPKAKSGRPESQPISDKTLALIKEKRKLRRQYSQAHDPLVKTRINQLQKEIKDNLRIKSQASWEKFCNNISLETNHTESWRKIKNFLKPKGQRNYPALRLDAKTAMHARLTLIRRNSLPKASKDTSVFRVIILIQNTLMRSISLSRITMNIFILLKTPMITDRTWAMIMTLWLMLTLILSLRQLSS